jgi:predicted porin
MKKSLFALAALGAFAGAAQAQSSVTVYGILDVGFRGEATRNDGAATAKKTQSTALNGTGNETTSRLGFRGTEDLGGGTRAFFTAEFELYPTDWNLSGNANAGLFNRQSFVGLGQKGIGQASIGTQYTPVHLAVGRTDPGQQNNSFGNVIYAVNANTGNGQTTTAYTVRMNNSLYLQSDRFAGAMVNAFYVNNNANNTQTSAAGGNTNNQGWGLGLNYVWNKLNFDAAYQTFDQITDVGATQTVGVVSNPTTRATITSTPTAFAVTNGRDSQMYFGAVYDFGILKAYAQYVNRKLESGTNSNNSISRTAQQIGVRGNITKTIEGWASVGNGRFQATSTAGTPTLAAGASTSNFTGYQVGSNYWLSKRTNLYVIFGSTQVSSSSTVASEGANNYALGLRHTF